MSIEKIFEVFEVLEELEKKDICIIVLDIADEIKRRLSSSGRTFTNEDIKKIWSNIETTYLKSEGLTIGSIADAVFENFDCLDDMSTWDIMFCACEV